MPGYFFNRVAVATAVAALLVPSARILAATSSESECTDKRVKKAFEKELDLQSVEQQCETSGSAKAGFYQTTYTDPEGRQQKMSCCAALRFLAYDSAKGLLQAKESLCQEIKQSIPSGAGGDTHYHRESSQFYDRAAQSNSNFADRIKKARERVEKSCPPSKFSEMAKKAKREVAAIQSKINKLPAPQQTQVKDSPGINIQ